MDSRNRSCPLFREFRIHIPDDGRAEERETTEEYDKMMDWVIEFDAFLIILDEGIHALNARLIEKEKLERVLDKDCEIVLTGRDAPKWIIDRADNILQCSKDKASLR